MTIEKQTRAAELKEFGISLAYLASVAGRSVGYVKQWSSGNDKSAYLDGIAANLIASRKLEKEGGLAK
jgi:hypothetical protein